MGDESIIGTLIAIVTGLTTYKGLTDNEYQRKYSFGIDQILIGKEYFRLITPGFLHANWIHFGFNMLALVSFAFSIEFLLGINSFLIIYFASLIGGSLLTLFIHRNHGDYSGVGASGAISGIIASSIILFPKAEIGLILVPLEISSWVFGLIFILISILGIKSQKGNIGHEAHLGGLLVGIVSTIIINPIAAKQNWWVLMIMLVPIVSFLALIIRRPDILITGKWNLSAPSLKRREFSEKSLDSLLDKIKKDGIDSLSKSERKLLDKYRDKM